MPFLFNWVPLGIHHSSGKVTNTNTNFIAIKWYNMTFALKHNCLNCYWEVYLDNGYLLESQILFA